MSDFDRRTFLTAMLASMGVAAATRTSRLAAEEAASGTKYRIDVHHHFSPPTWVAAMNGNPLLQAPNTTWTPEKSIEDLDRGGGAAAVLSITNPPAVTYSRPPRQFASSRCSAMPI
jgi:hypothetical protein